MRSSFLVRMVLVVLMGVVFMPRPAQAEPMREFIMSASYGVLAGTLVGAASLAFSDKPGDNLNKIARGASIGLYAGILLGLYVVYAVPSQEEAEIRDQLGYQTPRYELPRFAIAPLVGDRGLEGASAQYEVLRF